MTSRIMFKLEIFRYGAGEHNETRMFEARDWDQARQIRQELFPHDRYFSLTEEMVIDQAVARRTISFTPYGAN